MVAQGVVKPHPAAGEAEAVLLVQAVPGQVQHLLVEQWEAGLVLPLGLGVMLGIALAAQVVEQQFQEVVLLAAVAESPSSAVEEAVV